MRDLTLNETLASLGLGTRHAGGYRKHITLDGFTVFTGDAGEVWEWLRS